ncbi:hypothetical protein V1264_016637 [Littorina saxatilis]|uniref:Integrase catalytic domain-containing protein n=1 Tax=Littorina saxatilis TaxID=31220 RepID=A0AAN9BHF7_9CAEN
MAEAPAANPQRPHNARVNPPPPLNVKKGCEEWKLFKQMWQNYCIVSRLKDDDVPYSRALFLHTLGQEGLTVYNGLKLDDNPTVKQIMDAFDDHFIGKRNETYERYVFNKRDQKPNENVEDYIATLRTLANTCNFCECLKDTLLRDRIVLGIQDGPTRKELLQEAELTLEKCVHMCRAAESTSQQLKSLSVSAVDESGAEAYSVSHRDRDRNRPKLTSCKFCGQAHTWKKELCPAWGKTCKQCQKKNHFALKCTNMAKKKTKLHSIDVCDSDSESDTEQLLAVHSKQQEQSQKIIKAKMIVQGNTVACQVDCGASVNIIPARHAKDAALKETKKNLYVYNGTVLKPLGKTDLCIKNPRNGNNYKTEFIVIKENLTPLLGKKLSEEMGLITVNYDNFESVSRVDEKSDVLHDHSDVFSDSQGSLPGVATFTLKDNAVPVISASCRVPHAMTSKVEAELHKLTKEEIIAPVEEPTSWCSRMVVATKKSGKMRVCIDPRPLNKALKREHYPLPVMEDLLPRLSGAKVFSKLDLRNAYWHVHLDKESSLLTTFQTPFGVADRMQGGRPIAYSSRALTETETRYAQIEKEMLAIVFSLEKFHQYTFGRLVHIESDHKPLEAILQKPLSAAPRRLQGMMLRAQAYDIVVRYKKGKEMYLADTLSRAYINAPSKQEDIELVNMVAFLPIRQERLEKLKNATDDDETLQRLKKVIMTGWPEEKQDLPAELTSYFSFRDEISVQDGLIFKGERVVVPISMRHEMKTAVHSTHSGIDGCLKRARECLFWPGMSGDIKHFISSCEVCSTFQSANQPESLMPHDLPSRQWEKVGVDLFEFEGRNYLVTVDYFSNFWEIDRLENTTSTTIIKKLKSHFARYGSPCVLISDNGPQFTSENFKKFSSDFDFEHRTSSPYNSKANGKAESAVKTAKSLLRKNQDGDQFLALLNHRNTPSQATGTSPAQRFLNRRTRTLLPTTQTLLKPKLDHEAKDKLILSQKKQKRNFDKHSKDLPTLEEGDSVRLQPFRLGEKKWKKGVVARRLDDRSYEVEADGALYRRNRVHLRQTLNPPAAAVPDPNPASTPSSSQKSTKTTPSEPGLPAASPDKVRPSGTPSPDKVRLPGTPTATTAQPCSGAPTTPCSSRIPIRRSNREIKLNRSKDFVYN